jgi:hypothetical protein
MLVSIGYVAELISGNYGKISDQTARILLTISGKETLLSDAFDNMGPGFFGNGTG